jgi:hypothetical protein
MKQEISWQTHNLNISIEVAKKVVKDWMNRNYKKHWESITALKQEN